VYSECKHNLKQEALGERRPPSERIRCSSGIRSPDRGPIMPDFQNLSDFLVMKYHQFSQRCEPNCGKMPYLAALKNSAKTPGSGSRRRCLPNL